MGLTTVLRGFKVPITILDRFLESNGSDLRCDHCLTVFENWVDCRLHQRDTHGVELTNDLPDDF
ncbi:hypothetical protein C8A00DRAFT_32670 [Chaetomidium leptoderma]|uniref:C2H2-type domain-containing protein n=1 Tax=Chaetomidium leptoderma TaxID=669021 RepID=A0AAN6VQJ1_9PEZI|nr:hypothetical protein C8A00DRAFT_32670 [Chaetomidium leptoderma]